MSALLDMIRARLAELQAAKQLDPWQLARVPRFSIDPKQIPDGDVDAEIARIVATLPPKQSKSRSVRAIIRVIITPAWEDWQSYDDPQLELQKRRPKLPPERSSGVLIDSDDRPPNATSSPLSSLVSPSTSTRRSRLRTGWNLSR
jgi:hypothetical protein